MPVAMKSLLAFEIEPLRRVALCRSALPLLYGMFGKHWQSLIHSIDCHCLLVVPLHPPVSFLFPYHQRFLKLFWFELWNLFVGTCMASVSESSQHYHETFHCVVCKIQENDFSLVLILLQLALSTRIKVFFRNVLQMPLVKYKCLFLLMIMMCMYCHGMSRLYEICSFIQRTLPFYTGVSCIKFLHAIAIF